MFSYFANHNQNKPIGSLTIGELHRLLVNPDREPFNSAVNMIQRLREATDKAEQSKIKSGLLAFTPGAQVDTRQADANAEQKNIRYSGFMQIDIDLQDNPNMADAGAIRDKLAQIPYIALSAISARGKGVWGLLALQEPDKFTQYADQVNEYFKLARVTIDKSKSKNPTELRYFAPDPGAVLNTKYELLPLVAVQPKIKYKPIQTNFKQTVSTFEELQQWVSNTTGIHLIDGQKHYYLFWLAYALRKNGKSEHEVYNAIHSIFPAQQIHSNCISGGIAHANSKGIYKP